MAIRSKKSKSRKRTFKRRVRRNRRKAVVPKQMSILGTGLPKMVVVKHKYSQFITMTSSTSVAVQSFSCNGMFDPDITGVGHQPLYFDQFSALYDHYCVIGSRIKLRLTPSTTADVPSFFTLSVQDDTSQISTDPVFIAEQTQTKRPILLATGGSRTYNAVAKWSARKYFGKGVLANSTLQGDAGSNPSEQSYYFLNLKSGDGVTSTKVYIECEIEYLAVWKELKDVAAS